MTILVHIFVAKCSLCNEDGLLEKLHFACEKKYIEVDECFYLYLPSTPNTSIEYYMVLFLSTDFRIDLMLRFEATNVLFDVTGWFVVSNTETGFLIQQLTNRVHHNTGL